MRGALALGLLGGGLVLGRAQRSEGDGYLLRVPAALVLEPLHELADVERVAQAGPSAVVAVHVAGQLDAEE